MTMSCIKNGPNFMKGGYTSRQIILLALLAQCVLYLSLICVSWCPPLSNTHRLLSWSFKVWMRTYVTQSSSWWSYVIYAVQTVCSLKEICRSQIIWRSVTPLSMTGGGVVKIVTRHAGLFTIYVSMAPESLCTHMCMHMYGNYVV